MENPFKKLFRQEEPIIGEEEKLVEFKDEDGKLIWRKKGSPNWEVEYDITTGTPAARDRMAEIEARIKKESTGE